jgi:hypothetical protein
MTRQGAPDPAEPGGTSADPADAVRGVDASVWGTSYSAWSDAEIVDFSKILDEIVLDVEPIRHTPTPPPPKDIWTWIRSSISIGTIIDIGANTGDYAEFLDSFFHPAAIYAFEPLDSCQPSLRELAQRLPRLKVFQLALADDEGEET